MRNYQSERYNKHKCQLFGHIVAISFYIVSVVYITESILNLKSTPEKRGSNGSKDYVLPSQATWIIVSGEGMILFFWTWYIGYLSVLVYRERLVANETRAVLVNHMGMDIPTITVVPRSAAVSRARNSTFQNFPTFDPRSQLTGHDHQRRFLEEHEEFAHCEEFEDNKDVETYEDDEDLAEYAEMSENCRVQ